MKFADDINLGSSLNTGSIIQEEILNICILYIEIYRSIDIDLYI